MGTDALAVVERFVKSMQDGDIEGMLAHIDPRGVFKEAASLPYGGDWVGPEGFAALIETMRSSSEVRLENAEVFPCGERVLLRAELAVRGRATGRTPRCLSSS